MKTDIKNFPRGYSEDQLLYLIWEELSGGESGERGFLNSGRRKFPDGLDRKDLLYLIWKTLSGSGGKSLAEVSDITAIPASVLDELKVGDSVAKVTGAAKHLYVVTYKGDGAGEGICLTYAAAGYGETVSYDRSGSGWVYNSTDVETYSGDGGGCSCLSPMIVYGELDDNNGSFIPESEQPSFPEAVSQISNGGLLYLKAGQSDILIPSLVHSDEVMGYIMLNNPLMYRTYLWTYAPDITIHGSVADYYFTPDGDYPDQSLIIDSLAVSSQNFFLSYQEDSTTKVARINYYSSDEGAFVASTQNEEYVYWQFLTPGPK